MKFKPFISLCLLVTTVLMLTSCASDKEYHNQNPNYDSQNPYEQNTEAYNAYEENEFKDVLKSPLSTFSVDVDTASYSNMRRFLNEGRLPFKDSVRTEEFINYFNYAYPQPSGDEPFSVTTEVAQSPLNDKRNLVMIGLQGIKIEMEDLPANNLVFLLDVSGSMNNSDKLPLVKSALKLLVNNLTEEDRVSIVVYASASGVVLEPTSGDDKEAIITAIDRLSAGGSTNGGQGIQLAYSLAQEHFIPGGNNRVILATDGDFNVGLSTESELIDLIEEKREDDIFLSVLGFGTGNYKDNKMESLADKGNGNYAYIDSLLEAKKVLVEEMGGTLLTIAKDVKIQVEFNPAHVKGYRLIGYENRLLEDEDFNDDTKDAGEIGAGHSVTAFFEIIPADSEEVFTNIDDLKYQNRDFTNTEDLLTVKLRYKEPTGEESKLIEKVVKATDLTTTPSQDFQFATAVIEYSLLLRDSEHKGTANYDHVIEVAQLNKGEDEFGYRSEFIQLVQLAKELSKQQ